MTKKDKVTHILSELKHLFPTAKIMLNFSSPWELLVAVMLSAQCTDRMVNKVTKDLFKKYRKLEDYVRASPQEFEKDIFSTGFYHTKTKHILATAQIVKNHFQGKLPHTMEEITQLPGVGRKTANVVLGNAFGVVEGIAVDTHVKRISRVLGLTRQTDPEKIEKDLMKIVPRNEWLHFTYLLIEYGRTYCTAIKHIHENCPLTKMLMIKG